MAETELTKKLKRDIWYATQKMGVFGCFEVTIGFGGKERVDYMTYDTKGIWRCYEVKISSSDFHSNAKHTFVGNYNYYVMTKELFNEVETEISKNIGVYVNGYLIKRPKKQKLSVDKDILKDSMIRSLSREFEKQYKSNDETIIDNYKRKINRLHKEKDDYYHKYWKLMDIGQEKFGDRWYKDIYDK